MADVKFETIKEETVEFGTNKFLEIARKKAITDEGETEFISISRGFKTDNGEKRFSKGKNIALPVEKKVVENLAKALKEVVK